MRYCDAKKSLSGASRWLALWLSPAALACSNLVGGEGGLPGASSENVPPVIATSDEVDLLFVVDNSSSMQEKQAILAASVSRLITSLVDPPCVDAAGTVVAVPPSPTDPCPGPTVRRFRPVRSLHVGVIDSSLGALGADQCPADGAGRHDDDRGHLVDRSPPGTVPTYLGYGFLAWDPDARLSPPGESELTGLVRRASDLVVGVGERGCGYEMPLEAAYRFLVDPSPYASIQLGAGSGLPVAARSGLDIELLAERDRFLRPSSILSIVLLSDEDDCSVVAGGQDYAVLDAAPFFRAASLCATDPGSACCYSCGTSPPAPCAPDPACAMPRLAATEDATNLRCFDQKRRYGVDLLYPVARYANAFTRLRIDTTRADLDDEASSGGSDGSIANPLFAGGRDASLVTMTAIVGVPWQKLARDTSDPSLGTLSTAELAQSGFWAREVGDPSAYVWPTDPIMIESTSPRPGVGALAPNGGERFIDPAAPDDLEYACIYRLRAPVPASLSPECVSTIPEEANPICNGATRVAGKAYPGLRELAVLEGLGDRAVVASICPPTLDPAVDETSAGYGYNAAMDATVDRIARSLAR